MSKIRLNEIRGVDHLIKRLKELSAEIQSETQKALKITAEDIEQEAIAKAPTDMGALRQSIFLESKDNGFKFNIGANVSYAPFLEFGTRTKVRVPAGFEALAAKFKGQKGGTFDEFLEAIEDWVKKKGITGVYSIKTRKRTGNKVNNAAEDKRVAFLIVMSILHKGINAQPFLIPAFIKGRLQLQKDLVKVLKRAVK